MEVVGYPDPYKCAEHVTTICDDDNLDRSTTKILDLGCGTGKVGELLQADGFKNIMGVDCSEAMLHESKSKGCYTQLQQILLGNDEFINTFPQELRSKFNFAICSGVVENNCQGHDLMFEQMLLALKQCGYMIFTVQFSYMGDYWWSDKLEALENEGRILFIDSEDFFKYESMQQSVGKFSKTPVKVMIYQKIEMDSVAAAGKLQKKLSSKISDMSNM